MAEIRAEPPRVLIFDDSKKKNFLPFAQDGADQAGWKSTGYDNENYALEDFDETFSALVTAIRGDMTRQTFTGRELFMRSDELKIPRAIISAHNSAWRWLRLDSQDLLIPKAGASIIPKKLAEWLIHLDLGIDETEA